MAEIKIKVDVPEEFKERFELVLSKSMKSLVREMEFSAAKEIISKSKFTEEDANKLAEEVKASLHKKYKELYPELK